MVAFPIVLLVLIIVTLAFQVAAKMKLVPPSRLAVVHGKAAVSAPTAATGSSCRRSSTASTRWT